MRTTCHRQRGRNVQMATPREVTRDSLAKDANGPYNVGNTVSYITSNKDTYRGHVLAFDYHFRIVITENTRNNQLNIINLTNINNMEVTPGDPHKTNRYPIKQKVDLNKVDQKYKEAVEKREAELCKIGDNVTDEAQLLFNHIQSVYSETRWEGPSIVVMEDVSVSPPYQADNCTGTATEAVERVKKIITRFHSNKSLNISNSTMTTTPNS